MLIPRGSKLYEDVRSLTDEYVRNGKKLIRVEFVDPTRDVERAEQVKLENAMETADDGFADQGEQESPLYPGGGAGDSIAGHGCGCTRCWSSGARTRSHPLSSACWRVQRKFYFVVGKGARAEAGNSDVLKRLEGHGTAAELRCVASQAIEYHVLRSVHMPFRSGHNLDSSHLNPE